MKHISVKKNITIRQLKLKLSAPRTFILILLACLQSCVSNKEAPTQVLMTDTLVYLKSDLDKSLTGFIIARDGEKYYALTAKHGTSAASQQLLISPYTLRTEDSVSDTNTEDIDIGVNSVSAASILLPTVNVIELDGVDASVISFTTEKNLAVSKITDDSPKEDQGLSVHGFIKCHRKESENKFYFYHKTGGKIISKKDLENEEDKEIVQSIEDTQKKIGADMKYTASAKLGMSGGPIIDSDSRVMGMQIGILPPGETFSTCTIPPDNKVSYGISMKRILAAKNFPENVKKLMNK